MKRRYGREIALKVLYQKDITSLLIHDILEKTYAYEDIPEDIREFSRKIVLGTVEHWEDINKNIEKYAENWTIERIAVVDVNILRIALYELIYEAETPARVILNEAIEIAKKYGDTKSYQFINGILDKASRELRKDTDIMSAS